MGMYTVYVTPDRHPFSHIAVLKCFFVGQIKQFRTLINEIYVTKRGDVRTQAA